MSTKPILSYLARLQPQHISSRRLVYQPQRTHVFNTIDEDFLSSVCPDVIMSPHKVDRKRIAIVGSGISGLGALYALKDTPHEVHLYEAADRLGGHTNTVTFKHNGKDIAVDTGFIVMNTATYRMCPIPTST